MSHIFITNIVGTGTYAIPEDDTELSAATAGLDALISGIANLAYARVAAWVEDAGGPGGAEGTRTLNCLVQTFTYYTLECPPEQGVGGIDMLVGQIESTLQGDPIISSIDVQRYSLYETVSTPTSDIRAPAIIVGNAPAGDTTDICDYLDIGDGTQLAAAIAAAGAGATPLDVWIRPGTYDFDQPTSPIAAIIIPIGVTVRGAGRGSVTLNGRTDYDLCLFHLANNAELWDVYIEQQPPNPVAGISSSYPGVVDQLDSTGTACRRVEINMPGVYTLDQANDLDILAAFTYVVTVPPVLNAKYEECYATGPYIYPLDEDRLFTGFLFAVTEKDYLSEVFYEQCFSYGFDNGFSSFPNFDYGLFCGRAHLRECLSDDAYYIGIFYVTGFLGDPAYSEIERCRVYQSTAGYYGIVGNNITNSLVFLSGTAVTGIDSEGGIVSHNTVDGPDESIYSYSNGSVNGNRVDGNITLDYDSVCTGNSLSSSAEIDSSSDCTITGNSLQSGDIEVGGDSCVVSGNFLNSGDINIGSSDDRNLVIGNRVKLGDINVAGDDNKIAHNFLYTGSVNDTGSGNNLSGNI